MSKKGRGPYSLGVVALLAVFAIVTVTPAFAEVASLETSNDFFFRGEKIQFSVTVDQGSQGLVTITIYETQDEFVMITQARINSDNTFEKTITIGDRFYDHGIHKATGFILDMTKGASTEFGISLDGTPIDMMMNTGKREDSTIENILALEGDELEILLEDDLLSNKSSDEQKIHLKDPYQSTL